MLFKTTQNNNFAAIGIGAMIVFIAITLVAGIAASVIIQTANNLENQSTNTGQQTTVDVATGIRVIDIEGEKTTRSNQSGVGSWWNNTRIHNITITVTPKAGSEEIDLSNTLIEISNSTIKCILNYTSNTNRDFAAQPASGGIFSTTDVISIFHQSANGFGIIELFDEDGSCTATTPVINRGDKVMLCINASACFKGFQSRGDVYGMIIPEFGTSASFSFVVPSFSGDTVYCMYYT